MAGLLYSCLLKSPIKSEEGTCTEAGVSTRSCPD